MPKLSDDLKTLYKRAAVIGVVLAIACHVVPPEYRVPCDALAQLCSMAAR